MTAGSTIFRGTAKKLPHIINTEYFWKDPWVGLYDDEQNIDGLEP
jgi:hypothetical protein